MNDEDPEDTAVVDALPAFSAAVNRSATEMSKPELCNSGWNLIGAPAPSRASSQSQSHQDQTKPKSKPGASLPSTTAPTVLHRRSQFSELDEWGEVTSVEVSAQVVEPHDEPDELTSGSDEEEEDRGVENPKDSAENEDEVDSDAVIAQEKEDEVDSEGEEEDVKQEEEEGEEDNPYRINLAVVKHSSRLKRRGRERKRVAVVLPNQRRSTDKAASGKADKRDAQSSESDGDKKGDDENELEDGDDDEKEEAGESEDSGFGEDVVGTSADFDVSVLLQKPAPLLPDSDSLTVHVSNNPFVYDALMDSGMRRPVDPSGKQAVDKINPYTVTVQRDPELQEQRMELPVCAQEQELVEAILAQEVTIVCGATGSGKTTQIPQFLYEAGFGSLSATSERAGLIGVTEPRRVAAVSTAKRVAQELSLQFEKQVTYQIRYESKVGQSTQIKFMTDGILLREIQQDFLLRKYSVLVLDEAHERNLNTDLLIGLLSRIVPLRNQMAKECAGRSQHRKHTQAAEEHVIYPLRLVIMSATLRLDDFVRNSTLFRVAPRVMEVPSRQFPVTVHFSRRTPTGDYTREVFNKVVKIHNRLPPGGILVFLTGRQEIHDLMKRLKAHFDRVRDKHRRRNPLAQARPVGDCATQQTTNNRDRVSRPQELKAALDAANEQGALSVDFLTEKYGDVDDDDDDEDEDEGGRSQAGGTDKDTQQLQQREHAVTGAAETEPPVDATAAEAEVEVENDMPVRILPLYSLLATHLQMRVFEPIDESKERLIVMATNVAETSLTIPGIKYVVDPGKEKKRVYDRVTGTSQFVVGWVSKAAASQRTGRAGRTAPGHAYRLYSSAVFSNEFSDFAEPEILRNPIDGTVLQMKAMNIHDVANFPFPTPPDAVSLRMALHTLRLLGATGSDEKITQLGRTMAAFPIAPRFAKMLVLAHQGGCLPYVIRIVASLSVQQLFLENRSEDRSETNDEQTEAEDAGSGTKAKTLPPAEDGDEEKSDMAFDEGGAKKKKQKKVAVLEKEAEERDKEAQRQQSKRWEAARGRWTNRESDLLTNVRVVGGYEFAVDTADSALAEQKATEFCRVNFLRLKSMKEVHNLCGQLTRIVIDILKAAPSASALALQTEQLLQQQQGRRLLPPSVQQEITLRQIIAAGLVDRIARKMPRAEADNAGAQGGAYECLATAEAVYVHPNSALFDKQHQPECLVFHELVRTSKAYLKGCTAISSGWLFALSPEQCNRSALLDTPAPRFDAPTDRVVGVVNVTFGPKKWPLPAQPVLVQPLRLRVQHFARLLLEGHVVSALAKFRAMLTTKPQAIFLSPAMIKVAALVQRLLSQSVDSKTKLLAVW